VRSCLILTILSLPFESPLYSRVYTLLCSLFQHGTLRTTILHDSFKVVTHSHTLLHQERRGLRPTSDQGACYCNLTEDTTEAFHFPNQDTPGSAPYQLSPREAKPFNFTRTTNTAHFRPPRLPRLVGEPGRLRPLLRGVVGEVRDSCSSSSSSPSSSTTTGAKASSLSSLIARSVTSQPNWLRRVMRQPTRVLTRRLALPRLPNNLL
jgi:hypothetical protein